jgi:hypothetical protein
MDEAATSMPTSRHHVRPRRRYDLSHKREQQLRYGPLDPGDERARKLWQRHRDGLLAAHAPGHRPAAWFAFEHPELSCDYGRQASTLFAANLLGEAERAALMEQWRAAFEEILDLEDTDTRVAQLKAVDIPLSLFRQWAGLVGAAAGRERSPAAR